MREREREEGRAREKKAFFITLELLTSTVPCYKTEAKNLKEKQKKQQQV